MSGFDERKKPSGYKAPPPHTQFKKGTSGNPKGRPKKFEHALDINALILQEAARLITVKDHSGSRQISIKNAVICAMTDRALKGNVHAQKQLLLRIENAEHLQAMALSERQMGWRNYIATTRDEIARAQKEGYPYKEPLPHPDDIVFTADGEVHIHGPIDHNELKTYHKLNRMCDLLLMQDALDQRCQPSRQAGTALLIYHLMVKTIPDRLLPKNDMHTIIKMRKDGGMPKRELLKAAVSRLV